MLITLIGVIASVCTTASYAPQLIKAWKTNATDDLSLKMLVILVTGVVLWAIYGALRGDLIILFANISSATMVGAILLIKIFGKTS